MKKLIIALLLIAVTAQAGDYCATQNGTPLEGFCPNGLYSALLTVDTVTYDMTEFNQFSVFAPAAGKIRFMDSTDKTGHIAEPTVAGVWNTFTVNRKTPFVNLSSMTGGFLRRQ